TTAPLSSFSAGSPAHREPPSFPPRRSSDLGEGRASALGSLEAQPVDGPAPGRRQQRVVDLPPLQGTGAELRLPAQLGDRPGQGRSEEHTSELQSRFDLVCRLLLEKKKLYKY